MKKPLLALVMLVFVTCLFAKTTADYDHAVDFGKYHTCSWIGVTIQEPLWQDRVKQAIDNQLTAKGWHNVPSGGEASVSAFGSTQAEQKLETFYGGGVYGGWYHRGWWVGPGPGFVGVENVPVGIPHIDIFDAQWSKVIWHGVSPKPDKNEKKLEKDVADVFKKFPPRGKG